MLIRPAGPEDYEAVRQFLSDEGWRRRVADPERFREMMDATPRAVVALEDARVVGFARALCDGVSNGYISMVAVARDRRGRGIGRRLVEQLIGCYPYLTWVLRAGRDSRAFWEKLGFKVSEIAMEKVRQK
jgi:GNAT superfamily N-acetyltransferase